MAVVVRGGHPRGRDPLLKLFAPHIVSKKCTTVPARIEKHCSHTLTLFRTVCVPLDWQPFSGFCRVTCNVLYITCTLHVHYMYNTRMLTPPKHTSLLTLLA